MYNPSNKKNNQYCITSYKCTLGDIFLDKFLGNFRAISYFMLEFG